MEQELIVKLNIYKSDIGEPKRLPVSPSGISAGFPSPAEDFMEMALDLNRELIHDPNATFYARVRGVSMIGDGIDDGDLLVIDKSAEPFDGCLAVCFIDGEFTLKRFRNMGDYGLLVPSNPNYKPIKVTADNRFLIWGIVRYLIKKM